MQEENMTKKVTTVPSTQSFDIICDTPTTNETNKKFPSGDNIVRSDSDDYINLLDEEVGQNNNEDADKNNDEEDEQNDNLPPAPVNTPGLNNNNYDTKITQTIEVIDQLKSMPADNKTKKTIKSLEKHLEKIKEAEKKGVSYDEFIMRMIDAVKNDKQMNKYLRNLYSSI